MKLPPHAHVFMVFKGKTFGPWKHRQEFLRQVGSGTRIPYLFWWNGSLFVIPAATRYLLFCRTLPGFITMATCMATVLSLIIAAGIHYVPRSASFKRMNHIICAFGWYFPHKFSLSRRVFRATQNEARRNPWIFVHLRVGNSAQQEINLHINSKTKVNLNRLFPAWKHLSIIFDVLFTLFYVNFYSNREKHDEACNFFLQLFPPTSMASYSLPQWLETEVRSCTRTHNVMNEFEDLNLTVNQAEEDVHAWFAQNDTGPDGFFCESVCVCVKVCVCVCVCQCLFPRLIVSRLC